MISWYVETHKQVKMAPKSKQIYQIKVTLNDTHPPIWRRILVPGEMTLFKLHYVLQVAMGWTDSHLHQFIIDGEIYGDPEDDELGDLHTKDEKDYPLSRVVSGEGFRCTYEYDFSDSWMHTLVVEKIFPPEKAGRYPICIAGKRACPPEDVGGTWGFEEFLEAIRDPDHEEHDEYLEWAGGEFDPQAFDLEEVNQLLGQLEARGWQIGSYSVFNRDQWMGLFTPGAGAAAEALDLRQDAIAMLTYLRDNKVTGTQSTGNFTRKAVAEISARFVNPPALEEKIGDRAYRFQNESQIWPVYFLHVLAEIGDLISGGPAKRWRLTPNGEEFLAAPAVIQVWRLFVAWWYDTNWVIAFPFSGMADGLPHGFRDEVLVLLLECPPEKTIEFEPFADRLIRATGLIWPIEDQESAQNILRRAVRRMVIEPLAQFGILAPQYKTEETPHGWEFQELIAFRLTPLGSGMIETLPKPYF
jgi:hypothetical protein